MDPKLPQTSAELRPLLPHRRRPRRLVALGVLITLISTGCARRAEPIEIPDPAVDSRIQREVEARLAAEPAIGATIIRVEVEGARVLLHGSVRGIGAWNCAIRNAALVEGVRNVVDYLILERGPRDAPCLARRGGPGA